MSLQSECTFNGAWGGSKVPAVFYISSYFWDRATDVGLIPDDKTISVVVKPSAFRKVGAASQRHLAHALSRLSSIALRFSAYRWSNKDRSLEWRLSMVLSTWMEHGRSCRSVPANRFNGSMQTGTSTAVMSVHVHGLRAGRRAGVQDANAAPVDRVPEGVRHFIQARTVHFVLVTAAAKPRKCRGRHSSRNFVHLQVSKCRVPNSVPIPIAPHNMMPGG